MLIGASGSIGDSTLSVLRASPQMDLIAVSVHQSVQKLESILIEFKSIRFACISSGIGRADALESKFASCKFFYGAEGLIELIHEAHIAGADTLLTAVLGASGIHPTLAAIELGYKIALANKETMVTAGPVITDALARSPLASILPVDSEHNALFQLLLGCPADHIRRSILTASGGPFLKKSRAELKSVTKEDVLNHPTWSMGPKITVDSAGLINKGLEIIEAHFLFDLSYEKLDVFIHPISHVHALIETSDGYRMSASKPSMTLPIAHCLFFPEPCEVSLSNTAPTSWPPLEFFPVDEEQFPGFRVCMNAAREGGTAPAIFNAANEIAAGLFLDGLIQFTDIPVYLEMVLDRSRIEHGADLEIYLTADQKTRELTRQLVQK